MKISTLTTAALALLTAPGCTRSLMVDDGPDANVASQRSDAGPPDANGTAGRGSADGGGQTVDDDPFVPTNHWSGNADACPLALPTSDQPCALEGGEICAYSYDDPQHSTQSIYRECACRSFCSEDGLSLRWDCYRNTVSAGPSECPPEQPEPGSDCYGFKGADCEYPPLMNCKCPRSTGDDRWACMSEAPRPELPRPTEFDESKRISDLSDADRDAWCEWFTRPEPGFPRPRNLEPDADGFYPDTGCSSTTELGCPASIPDGLSQEACVANLALSTCEAALGELIDCALFMRTFHPSSKGCARFLTTPGCSGTIVIGEAVSGPPDEICRVRVR